MPISDMLRAASQGDYAPAAALSQTNQPEAPSNIGQVPDSPDMGGPSPLPEGSDTPKSPDMGGMSPLTSFNQPSQGTDGFGGKLKNALQRFSYYAGQYALKSYGMPTDYQIQKDNVVADTHRRQLQIQQQNADTESRRAATYQQSVDNKPDGDVGEKIAQRFKIGQAAGISGGELTRYALTGAMSAPAAEGASVMMTPEIAGSNPALKQLIGKNVKLTDLAGQTRSEAIGNGIAMGAAGPVVVPKFGANKGQATPVTVNGKGVGNPGVAVVNARAAVTPFQTTDGRTINNLQALKEGAAGATNPLVKMGMNAYVPAYDADNRFKQMIEQAQNPNPASDKALLFNHIAMTIGAVKGGRVTQSEIDAHLQARDLESNVLQAWDRVKTGKSLTPDQRDNFLRLGLEVRNSTWQTAQNKAAAFGVKARPDSDPDLPEVPDSGILGGGLDSVSPKANALRKINRGGPPAGAKVRDYTQLGK